MAIDFAMVQMDVVFGDREANGRKALLLTEGLGPTQILLLPELWNTAYDLKNAQVLAEDLTGPSVNVMKELAVRHKALVGGSLLIREGKGIYNTFVLISPDGSLAATYSKAHLFRLMEEDVYLTPGQCLTTVSTDFGLIGLAICYDMRFPELFRYYSDKGVDIVLLCAQWPKPRLNHWCTLARARAIENQCFFLACNRVGQGGSNTFFGNSLALDPWGDVLAEGDDQERVLTGKLDFSILREARTTLSVLTDKRRDLF